MRALRDDRIGRYELLIELARGGMAELFLGRLHGAGGFAKLVAIKRILPHLAGDAQFKEMFLNEGRIAAHLSHPNVCQVFELEQDGDELYLAMEYLDGVSWDHLARELAPGSYAMRLGVGVMVQACEGLHYAHALRDAEGNTMQVVHRDVSPQNLFVTVDGACKVLDFGVSKVMTDGPRTKSGVIKGKLPYMAPEQIRGEHIDGRADVFALGVCMWEALAGQRLFDRSTDFLIWKAITEEEVPSIATHWPECPPALDAVVRRALAREPAHRFATARELADALRAACPLPPCTNAEIAEAVKARCGDKILERQREVATALSARRAPDFDAATTTDRAIATSMEIRQQSVTLDLRTEAKRARLAAEEEAAETRDLRRDAAETRAAPQPTESLAEPAPRTRGHWRMLLVAILAAAATAVIVVVLMRREPPATPVVQQVTPPAPAPVVTPPPVDAAAPVAVETPVDAAPVVVTKKKAPRKAPKTTPTAPEVDETETSVEDAAKETQRAGEDLRRSMEKLRDSLGGQ